MKSFLKSLVATLFCLVAIAFTSLDAACGAVGVPFIKIKLPQGTAYHVNGVEVETWVRYIVENLFKDNEFLTYSFDEGDFVLDGKVVHIPQAGSKRNIV